MHAFFIRLEAHDPAHGRFRSYRLEAGTDLFGAWLIDVCYGRMGTPGRLLRTVARDEGEARLLVRRCLQRRATAPRRIGVAYRICELQDTGQWVPEPVRLAIESPIDASCQ